MEENIEKLRFPIGKFEYQADPGELHLAIEKIRSLPVRLRAAVNKLSDDQLDSAYRDGGWTLRQVIHHIADSHINAYIRFKLASTEENPNIKPYDEVKWAECEDALHGDIHVSLHLIDALHARWIMFLKSLSSADLERTYYHPVIKKQSKLIEIVSMYAWHGDHHLAHITKTKEKNKW